MPNACSTRSSTQTIRKSWDNSDKKLFTFIDLFAGIGGFRIAAESNGGVCVFSSEWDKNSCKTYFENHNDFPNGDITKIPTSSIPDHDILFGGFPCQAFSISGKRLGFNDTRGTLFFDVARILKDKKPRCFLLENVKNLVRHDNGRTFKTILNALSSLGYTVFHQVLRSSDFGVPQARERIYIVGFRGNNKNFKFPEPLPDDKILTVSQILENRDNCNIKKIDRQFVLLDKPAKPVDKRRPYQIAYFGNGGQGERIYSIDAAGITLSAYGGGIASRTGAYKIGDTIRKLTPRECARMQGFPEDFEIVVPDTLAYKQFGDSVSVPVLQKIISRMLEICNDN